MVVTDIYIFKLQRINYFVNIRTRKVVNSPLLTICGMQMRQAKSLSDNKQTI